MDLIWTYNLYIKNSKMKINVIIWNFFGGQISQIELPIELKILVILLVYQFDSKPFNKYFIFG